MRSSVGQSAVGCQSAERSHRVSRIVVLLRRELCRPEQKAERGELATHGMEVEARWGILEAHRRNLGSHRVEPDGVNTYSDARGRNPESHRANLEADSGTLESYDVNLEAHPANPEYCDANLEGDVPEPEPHDANREVRARHPALPGPNPEAWAEYLEPRGRSFIARATESGGLYLFVLPYATKWRSGRRTD